MKAVLKIEAIGDNCDQFIRFNKCMLNDAMPGLGDLTIGKIPVSYFVAEVVGFSNKYKYKRRFLNAKKDYTHANSVGSRGVYLYYFLESGKIYDIKQPISWRRTLRYFCKVAELGDIENLTEQEVTEWLKKNI